jgi:hypothetical protein
MRLSFIRVSFALALALLLVLAGAAGIQVRASQPAQATEAPAADEGPYPPCPEVIPEPTAEASGAATVEAAAPAATAAAAGTAAANPAADMKIEPFKQTKGCTMFAKLSGTDEVPNPGEPKGGGDITLVVSRGESGGGTICYLFNAFRIKLPAKAAHIHAGPKGVAGPVVVPLSPPNQFGRASACTTGVSRDLITKILTTPYNYYVNVHTEDFPGGAVRGQLVAPPQ